MGDVTQASGWLLDVDEYPLGSVVVGAHPIGATVLTVADASDYDIDGGSVVLPDESVVTYDSADLDAETLTLTTPLAVALEDQDRITIWDALADAPVTEVRALVEVENDDDGDDDPIEASLAQTLVDRVPFGPRSDRGELAILERRSDPSDPAGGEWRVVDVQGVKLKVDGNFIDPTTIPDKEASELPVSPTLAAVGLPDSIMLRTSEIASTTLLTFEVSVDAGATWQALNSTPVRSTLWMVKHLPNGAPLDPNKTYKFRARASNNVGLAAAASATVDGKVDTSAIALIASLLITAEVVAGFALLGVIHIGGDTFTLSPPGVDPDNPAGGLRIQLSDGGLIHLPADGSPAVLNGSSVIANRLEVIYGATIGGDSRLNGSLKLAGWTVADPTEAPQVSNFYDTVQTPVSGATGLCRSVGNDGWVISVPGVGLKRVDDVGDVVDEVLDSTIGGSVTKVGSDYYVTRWGVPGATHVWRYDANLDFVAQVNLDVEIGDNDALGTDGTNLLLTRVAADSSGYTGARRYIATTGAFVSQMPNIAATFSGKPAGGIYFGPGDFGATDRWVFHPRETDVLVYTNSGVRNATFEWPRPHGREVRGLWWDGSRFWVVDQYGIIRKLETPTEAPVGTSYWSYTWPDSDTHTTAVSPVKSHTRAKRAKIRVTCPPAPHQSASGTHVANRIAIFASTTSGATKYQQGATLPVGVKVGTYLTVATSGTAAPASNNWSTAAPKGIATAELNGFWVDGLSDGSIGAGGFRESIRTDGDARYRPKVKSAGMPVWAYGNSFANPSAAAWYSLGQHYLIRAAALLEAGTVTSYAVNGTRILNHVDAVRSTTATANAGHEPAAGALWPGTSSRQGLVVLDSFFNDFGHYATMQGVAQPLPITTANTHYKDGVVGMLRTFLAFVSSQTRIEQTSGTFTGTWINTAAANAVSGGSLATTSTVGAAVEFSVTPPQYGPLAGKVHVIVQKLSPEAGVGSPATINVQVDGGAATAYTPTPWEQYNGTGGQPIGSCADAIPVTLPVDGAAHTIKLTHAGTAGQRMIVDVVLVPSEEPNPIAVMGCERPPNPGLWTATQVGYWKQNAALLMPAFKSVVAEFPHALYVPSTMTASGQYSGDGNHPNDKGMAQRAADLALACESIRARLQSRVLDNASGYAVL